MTAPARVTWTCSTPPPCSTLTVTAVGVNTVPDGPGQEALCRIAGGVLGPALARGLQRSAGLGSGVLRSGLGGAGVDAVLGGGQRELSGVEDQRHLGAAATRPSIAIQINAISTPTPPPRSPACGVVSIG